MKKDSSVAVVVPSFNEATRLPLLLADLAAGPADLIAELVVVDGGSRDGTPQLARQSGARVLHTQASRGWQLQCGVACTTAPWLLLLHADARLQPGWSEALQRAMAAPEARGPRPPAAAPPRCCGPRRQRSEPCAS
jgi:glycosyltransferase involved in cell wall biosynthesis